MEYAHQKGVVHRDLKPANILIDHAGHPKVLDFGIARSTDLDVWHTTMHTATGQIVGTLAYMSPEQLSGDTRAVDTRADVYALGVILFELLGSRQPFDVAHRPLTEAVRMISEKEPPLLGTLNRALRGDVETIVQKALEKDPERRYESASALAGDIERFLAHEPIHARPVSTVYQLRKLVVRHKMPFVFAALLFVAVTALAVVSTVQASRIASERDRAVQAEAKAHQRSDQVRRLAHSFIFDVHDRIKNLPGSTKARAYIAETAMEYLDHLRRDAGGDIEVLIDIAAGYVKVAQAQGAMSFANMGKTAAAEDNLHKAVEILEPLCTREPSNQAVCGGLATAYETLGEVYLQQGKGDQAAEVYQKSLAIAERLLVHLPNNRRARRSAMVQANNIGETHAQRGRIQEAFDVFQDGVATAKLLAKENPDDAQAQQDLIYSHTRMSKMTARLGRADEAAAHAQNAFALIEPLALRHPENGEIQRVLAVACIDQGDHLRADERGPQAFQNYERAQAIYEVLVAADPDDARARMDLANSAERLGEILHDEGDLDEAMKHFQRSCQLREENARAAPDSAGYRREFAVAHEKIGNVYLDQADFERALTRYDQSLAIRRDLADSDPTGQQSQRDFAVAHFKLGSAHAGSAKDTTQSVAERVSRWGKARECFQSSIDHLRWMEENKLTSPSDANVPAFLQGQIEQAESSILALQPPEENAAVETPE